MVDELPTIAVEEATRVRAAVDGAPYEPLATIDDVYPERPDRAQPGGSIR